MRRYLLHSVLFLISIWFLAFMFPSHANAADENSVDIGPIIIKKQNSSDTYAAPENITGIVKYRVMLDGEEIESLRGERSFRMETCKPGQFYRLNNSSWPPRSCSDILLVSNFGPGNYDKYYDTVDLSSVGDARVEIYEVFINEPAFGGSYTEVEGGPFPRLLPKGASTNTIGYSWSPPIDLPSLTITPTTLDKKTATGKEIKIQIDLGNTVDQAYGIEFRPIGYVQVICENPGRTADPGCYIRQGETGDNYVAILSNTSLLITLKNIETFVPQTYSVKIGYQSKNQALEGTFAILDGDMNNSLKPILSPSSMTGEQSRNGKVVIKIQNPLDATLNVILPKPDRNGKTFLTIPCSAAKCETDYLLPAEGLGKGPHIIKVTHDNAEKGSATLTITDSSAGGGQKKTFGCSPEELKNSKNGCTKSAGKPCGEGDSGIETAIGCVPTEPSDFINGLMKMSAGLGGGIALLLMIQGSFVMITSQGNADSLKKGREQFIAAVSGLLFIIFSVTLLQVIGVDILQLPGFTR